MPRRDEKRRDLADFALNEDNSAFIQRGQIVQLSPRPFNLLSSLFSRRGLVVSYKSLLWDVYQVKWPRDAQRCGDIPQIHTLQQHKRTIDRAIGFGWITNEQSLGYKLKTVLECRDPVVDISDGRTLEEIVATNPIKTVRTRKRNTAYENARSLEFDDFIERLGYGPQGVVTIAFPFNLPQPSDDFAFRLYNALEEAGWPVSKKFGKSHYQVSGFGVTLGAVPDNDGIFPPHLSTLRYALERSGLPVQSCIVSPDRQIEGVSLIVGAEAP